MVNQVIAKYSYCGKPFEILLDSDRMKQYKDGSIKSLTDVMISHGIFRDIRLAKRVDNKMLMQEREGAAHKYDDATLMEVFRTTDIEIVAKIILEKGEIQYTTEQRRDMLEKKKRKIINIIASQAINPQMGIAYTYERIENAIKQAKIRIDPNEHAETQISRIMDALKPLIPISIEQVEVNLRIPIQFAGRVRSELSKRAVIQKDTWGASEWICQVRFYAGMKSEIYDTLNRLTNGQLISEEEKK